MHETKSYICHTLEGEDPGFAFLGFHIRQYRVGKHQSGKRPGGQRLGYKTPITSAKATIQEHLAELGQIIRRSRALPQGEVICQFNPAIRGWVHYYRLSVSKAAYACLDALTWAKLRSWAHRRYPTKITPWVIQRYWHLLGTRLTFATSATAPYAGRLHTHSGVPITRHITARGTRSPYDGDWVYWSTRQGRHPGISPRLALLLKQQQGRCAYCGLFFHCDDRIEIDHIDGDRRNVLMTNLQALPGHYHDAKTREHGHYLPPGMRDQPWNSKIDPSQQCGHTWGGKTGLRCTLARSLQ